MKTHTAYAIRKEGTNIATFDATMQRGCLETKQFAISSGVVTGDRGISMVIPKDASPGAVRRAIEILEERL